MPRLLKIQDSIICENCRICNTRPLIEQVHGGKYIVRCRNSAHYQTKPGMIDIDDWNNNNNRLNVDEKDNIIPMKR